MERTLCQLPKTLFIFFMLRLAGGYDGFKEEDTALIRGSDLTLTTLRLPSSGCEHLAGGP